MKESCAVELCERWVYRDGAFCFMHLERWNMVFIECQDLKGTVGQNVCDEFLEAEAVRMMSRGHQKSLWMVWR